MALNFTKGRIVVLEPDRALQDSVVLHQAFAEQAKIFVEVLIARLLSVMVAMRRKNVPHYS